MANSWILNRLREIEEKSKEWPAWVFEQPLSRRDAEKIARGERLRSAPMANSILGKKGFCPHVDPDYDGPSNFWCDDCSEIKDEIRDRKQRRYEIARDVMADKCAKDMACREVLQRRAVYALEVADALLAELEREDAD